MGAIGDSSVISILKEFVNDPIIEVAETCQLSLKRLEWLNDTKNKDLNLSENPYASVDPAPPAETMDIQNLTNTLLNENASLFDRYRAMFSLRNLRTKESAVSLSKGFFFKF